MQPQNRHKPLLPISCFALQHLEQILKAFHLCSLNQHNKFMVFLLVSLSQTTNMFSTIISIRPGTMFHLAFGFGYAEGLMVNWFTFSVLKADQSQNHPALSNIFWRQFGSNFNAADSTISAAFRSYSSSEGIFTMYGSLLRTRTPMVADLLRGASERQPEPIRSAGMARDIFL